MTLVGSDGNDGADWAAEQDTPYWSQDKQIIETVSVLVIVLWDNSTHMPPRILLSSGKGIDIDNYSNSSLM